MIDTFWLVLGYGCNNRCKVCYADPNSFTDHEFMPVNRAIDVIEEMKSMGVRKCLLIGGEPTLHLGLFEIIEALSYSGLISTLITNGRRLQQRSFVQRLNDAGIGKVVISLQGSTSSVHDGITRTVGSFKETVKGIEQCLNFGVRINVLTTIQADNADDCVRIPEFVSGLGLSAISFNCGVPCVTKNKSRAEYILSPSTTAQVIEKIYRRASIDGERVDFNVTIPLCVFSSDSIVKEMMGSHSIAVGCQMYKGKGIVFDPNGNILPCTHFADFPLIRDSFTDSGFALRGKLEKAWSDIGGIPGQFRNVLWRYPTSNCKECKYWGACIGGCPLLWSCFDPNDFISRKEVNV